MKKVVFAWIEEIIDFDTRENAEKYFIEGRNKGWQFNPKNGGYLTFEDCVYRNGNTELPWSLQVEKPYGNYYPGW